MNIPTDMSTQNSRENAQCVGENAQIVGIGANVYDTLVRVGAFPAEDTKCDALGVVTSGGGPCATGLVAAAKLGARTAALAVLSTDAGGAFLLDDYRKFGVDTRLVELRDGESFSATVILNAATGSRTCLLNRGTLPKLALTPGMEAAIAQANVLLLDGNELPAALAGAQVARAAGTHVLYDADGLYPGYERLLPWVDVLIPSANFARRHTGCDSLDAAARKLAADYDPEVVVITDGERGGVMWHRGEATHYPAFHVHVVDSNGAGDVFHGAFAFALTRGWDYARCCRFSSAVSALKCGKLGARQAVPTLAETLEFLGDTLTA